MENDVINILLCTIGRYWSFLEKSTFQGSNFVTPNKFDILLTMIAYTVVTCKVRSPKDALAYKTKQDTHKQTRYMQSINAISLII